jgi:hypothetical protein
VAGRKLLGLAFAAGLIGGLRQTASIFALALLVVEILRHGNWVPLRRLPLLGLAMGLGLLAWIAPLLYESGGWTAWYSASHRLFSGNIWDRSLLTTGMQGLKSRFAMIEDLGLGMGLFLAPVPWLLAARLRGGLKELDTLLLGWAIPLGFYAVMIYDTQGYMLAPVLALGAWVLLGCASLLAERSPGRQVIGAMVLCLLALGFPLVCGRNKSAALNPYKSQAYHDSVLRDRFSAVRREAEQGRISNDHAVLVTSDEYWLYGFRHVSYYLPEWTTVQLRVDSFFEISRPETPYLAARQRRVTAVGPDPMSLSSLVPGADLRQVIYMVPHDYQEFIDPDCRFFASYIDTDGGEKLAVIRKTPRIDIVIDEQRLRCVPDQSREPKIP